MKKQLLFLLLAGSSFTTFAQRTIQTIQPRQQEVRCVKLMTMPDSYHDWIYGYRYYYVYNCGFRLRCNINLPQRAIASVEIITGGTPCEYSSEYRQFAFTQYISRHHESKKAL